MTSVVGSDARMARTVLDAVPWSAAVLDGAGSVLCTNPAWPRLFAPDAAPPAGASYLRDCLPKLALAADQAASLGACVEDLLAGRRDDATIVCPCRPTDGTRTVTISATRLANGSGPCRVLIVHENRPDALHGRAEGSEQQLRLIVNSLPILISYVDAEGRYVFNNRAYEEWFDAPPGGLNGRTVAEVVGPSAFRKVRPHLEAALAGRRASYERVMVRPDQGGRWMHTTLVPNLDDAGRVVGFAAMSIDITERKREAIELSRHREHLQLLVTQKSAELERASAQLRTSERLASIGTLAAGLAHDISNLLFPMRCRLDTLGRHADPGAARDIEALHDSAEFLQQLCSTLRLFALDPEERDASEAITSPGEWWPRVSQMFRRLIPQSVALTGSVPADLPLIPVAPHRLTQALLNLLMNACDATGEGGHVHVWAKAHRRGVRIGVSDDGCGMAPDVKRRVLEPFFTTKRQRGGTGLGLTLVHGVAAGAGGRVGIYSRPGVGTSIVLSFPVAPAQAADRHAAPGAAITIADRRIATYLATLLSAMGAAPRHTDAPGDERLWITEPTPGNLPLAQAFVRRSPANRILVLGPRTEPWSRIGAIAADGTDSRVLKDALARAARAAFG